MAPKASFSKELDKEIGYVQSLAPNVFFSIEFDKQITDNQYMDPVGLGGWSKAWARAQEAARPARSLKISK